MMEKRDFLFVGVHVHSSSLEACNFIKIETPADVFSVTLAKFLRTPFL